MRGVLFIVFLFFAARAMAGDSAGLSGNKPPVDSVFGKSKWIGYEQGFPWDSVSKFSRLSARYFRKEFDEPGKIRKATLRIIGLGHYEVAINGHRVGDQVLAQAPTDYTQSVLYSTYDVTDLCLKGKNAIGVTLGNGRFFTMRPKYKPQKIKEFGFPKLLLELELVDDKGKRMIVSDGSWKFTADGPIRTNNLYDGEEYDATKELGHWTAAGYGAGHWLPVQLVAAPGGKILPQQNEPIKVMMKIKPIAVQKLDGDRWILDMGQNMAGWLQLKVQGRRGTSVSLRYAETLQKDGSLYTANLRDAKVTDIYTLKGEGEEVWHPVFVFHGFRYVEISGYPGTPTIDDFEGQVVYDNLATIGEFRSSDSLLNRIVQNAWWSINSNYKGIPMDCPQRNERMPWLGDRATESLGESYLFANENFYAKWLNDIQQSQKPDGSLPDVAPAFWNYYTDNMTWPSAYLLIADMLYKQFGNLEPIRDHYPSMKKWLGYMRDHYLQDGIMTKDKYGDWCVPPESPELIHARDSSRMTDGKLIATAYYYHLLDLMKSFAGLLHLDADTSAYASEMVVIGKAFDKKFYRSEGYYGNNTVTANLLPLYFDMVPRDKRDVVLGHITGKIDNDDDDHISTGVVGTQWLLRGLSENGRADLAYKIASNKEYPGWGYMVEHGATTIWELWNGNTASPAMNSQNHVMLLGDLVAWCFQDLGGISAQQGYKHFRMKPFFPDGLDSVQVSYRTGSGWIGSHWKMQGNDVVWDIMIPEGTSASVELPGRSREEAGPGAHHYVVKTGGWVLGGPLDPAIVKEEFLYEKASFPECHAATIAESSKGLVASFFGGTKERNPDVCIYVVRKDKDANGWTAPVKVADGIQNDTLRYACWNPVLYQVPGGDLLLFYKVGPSPSKWKGWMLRSKDGGISWSKPEKLPDGILGAIKNKPVGLANGDILSPSSVEGSGPSRITFEKSRDGGHGWEMMSAVPADTFKAIQPTILFLKNGGLAALSRTSNRTIVVTISSDNGRTWSVLKSSGLPNNNSGLDGVTLKDGRQLLVYNHVLPPPGVAKGDRSPLNVAISSDDGRTWDASLVLESDKAGQYSYPSVIQSADGLIHIVYTWRRKKIKYVVIDPSKLKAEKIDNGVWPSSIHQ